MTIDQITKKIKAIKVITDPKPKTRPIHTMATIQVAFSIRFVCDAEARLNSTVKKYNDDKSKVEDATNRQHRGIIANLLQEHLTNQLPIGISCIVEDNSANVVKRRTL